MQRRLKTWFRTLSLRTWLIIGMAVALLPLFVMAAFTYGTYHDRIAEPFRDVITAQHRVLVNLERIQGKLWQMSVAVNDFALTGDEGYRADFLEAERDIVRHLPALRAAAEAHPGYLPTLEGIEAEWGRLTEIAGGLRPGTASSADPDLQGFETLIVDVALRMEDVAEAIRSENEASHADALAAMEQLERFALAAAALTLIFTLAAIQIIDRALINSTDELVAGARRITKGDREHKIDVQVPPELAAVATAFNDMTLQIVRQEQALALSARTDSLTGLFNRREFDVVLAREIAAAEKAGARVALLMIDVDHFKRFNDRHGHLAGDEALRQIAGVLREAGGHPEHSFRYGGEEFAFILTGVNEAAALEAAEHIRAAVEAAGVTIEGQRMAMSVSIGVSIFGGPTKPRDMIERSDRALYEAKNAGRNQVRAAGRVDQKAV
ncbi:diguanylate cyclase [Pseudoroseicyclus sp. H15]